MRLCHDREERIHLLTQRHNWIRQKSGGSTLRPQQLHTCNVRSRSRAPRAISLLFLVSAPPPPLLYQLGPFLASNICFNVNKQLRRLQFAPGHSAPARPEEISQAALERGWRSLNGTRSRTAGGVDKTSESSKLTGGDN